MQTRKDMIFNELRVSAVSRQILLILFYNSQDFVVENDFNV